MKEEFLTVKEIAKILNVHENTIRNSIKSGHIQYFRTGIGKKSHYRIPHTEIERLAEFNMSEVIENKAKELIEKTKK
jgi:DNA binding domain, excisionase family